MFEYDVAVVKGKGLGTGHTWNEARLQAVLDEHARAGWRLRFIVEERERLLVVLERPCA